MNKLMSLLAQRERAMKLPTRSIAAIAIAFICESSLAIDGEIMFCGSPNRTEGSLVMGSFTATDGCTPAASTDALLVTRGTTVTGKGAAWLSFLNNGGNIITEYDAAETVYNEIYSKTYNINGVTFGNCQDNIMPFTKVNPTDAFWVANPWQTVASGMDSCGQDLQAIVSGESGEVIALGERETGSISLAYRNQGSGTLFLSTADWSDGEPVDFSASKRLVYYMLAGIGWQDTDGDGIPDTRDPYPNDPTNSPTPVPTLPLFGFGILVSLLGLFGLRKLRQ